MRAAPTSWKRRAFQECVSVSYEAVFDAEQFSRITDGLVPDVMEDKWFIYYEEPHLFLHRSWTGQPVYRLRFENDDGRMKVVEAYWSKDLADRAGANEGEGYQVRLLDFLLCNLLLGQAKPFPLPSDFEDAPPGAFQYHIAGTGYAQSPNAVVSALPAKPKRFSWLKLLDKRH